MEVAEGEEALGQRQPGSGVTLSGSGGCVWPGEGLIASKGRRHFEAEGHIQGLQHPCHLTLEASGAS